MFSINSKNTVAPKDGEFDPDSFLSDPVKERKMPPWDLKYPPETKVHPNPISMGGGMPNYGFFPVKSLEVNLKSEPFATEASEQYKVVSVDDKTIDLKGGLQYSNPMGLSHMQTFMSELVKKVHPPAYKDYKITVSSGNGNSINKTLDVILNEGDVLLLDQYNYKPILANCTNYNAHAVPLKVKDGKTDIEYLTNLLDNWSSIYPDLRKPKVFYTIPNGSNPYGVVATDADKKAIYALAEKHNFMILEDDPYGYISLPKYTGETPKPDTIEEYLASVGSSYLELDTSGRVLRIETFSKVFAPGLRLGFIVGHEKFINAIMLYSFVVTGQLASGPSQILLSNTVAKWGGVDGYLEWVYKVRNNYVARVTKSLNLLYNSKPYKEGKFKILEPEAGMFLTLSFDKDLTPLIKSTIEHGVVVVKGANMKIGNLGVKEAEDENDARFIRVTYAALIDEELTEALNRLIESIDEGM